MVQCPICKNELVSETRDGVSVDVCADHGIWLDQHELLLITEHERHTVGRFTLADLFRTMMHPPGNVERALACPRCSAPMKLERYAEVTIDWCEEHGVWLDRGELEAILNNLRLDPAYLRGVALRLSEARF